MNARILLLLALCSVVGCLKPSPSPSVTGPVQLFDKNQPVPEFDYPYEGGFTGAVVYGDPKTCKPCEWLDSDLFWLAEEYDWSVGFGNGEQHFDWTLITDTDGRATPTIEFYVNDELIETSEGYTKSDEWSVRKPILKALIAKHPKRKRADGA